MTINYSVIAVLFPLLFLLFGLGFYVRVDRSGIHDPATPKDPGEITETETDTEAETAKLPVPVKSCNYN